MKDAVIALLLIVIGILVASDVSRDQAPLLVDATTSSSSPAFHRAQAAEGDGDRHDPPALLVAPCPLGPQNFPPPRERDA
jgi:hypothetical protein